MKKIIPAILALCLCGCASQRVTKFNPATGERTEYRALLFFAKSIANGTAVDHTTKGGTGTLLAIKTQETSVDSEGLDATGRLAQQIAQGVVSGMVGGGLPLK